MRNVVHVHVAKYMYSVHVRKILLACETRYKCTCTCIVRNSHVYYSNTLWRWLLQRISSQRFYDVTLDN